MGSKIAYSMYAMIAVCTWIRALELGIEALIRS